MQGKPPDIMGAGQACALKGSWAGLQVKSYAWEEPDTGLEKAAGRPLPNRGMREASGRRPPPRRRRSSGSLFSFCSAPSTLGPPVRPGRGGERGVMGPELLSARVRVYVSKWDSRSGASEREAKSISTSKVNLLIARMFKIPRGRINIHQYIFPPLRKPNSSLITFGSRSRRARPTQSPAPNQERSHLCFSIGIISF